MKILSLELVGYKRLGINGGKYFYIQPNSPIQLILGTNGSGKSSLVRELSPLPASKSDYEPTGSKTIQIAYRGNKYTLKSWFANGNKHSFVKNGDELNEGGTGKVQAELVRQEFNYTSDVHALRLGTSPAMTFTGMSPSARREWFTRMSDVNYDYAIKLFQTLKTHHRDLQGTLKRTKVRLVDEIAAAMSKEDEAKLQAEVLALSNEMNALIAERTPQDKTLAQHEEDMNQGLRLLENMASHALRFNAIRPIGSTFTNDEELEVAINKLRHEVTQTETLINQHSQNHERLTKNVATLKETGESGIRELQDKITLLRNEQSSILEKRRLKLEGFNPITALSAIESIIEPVAQVLGELPPNSERVYSQKSLLALTERGFSYKTEAQKLEVEVAQLRGKKGHMEAHRAEGEITCPNCKHGWIPNFSEAVYKAVCEEIEEKGTRLTLLAGLIKETDEAITQMKDYAEKYRAYMSIVNSTPALKPLWDYLNNEQIVIDTPSRAFAIIQTANGDIHLEAKAHAFEAQIEETKRLIAMVSSMGDANLTEVTTQLDETTILLERLTRTLTSAKMSLNEHINFRTTANDLKDIGQKIEVVMRSNDQIQKDLIIAHRNYHLDQAMAGIRSSYLIKQEMLDMAGQQKNRIQFLEDEIRSLEVDEKAAKLLVQEISPSGGLIAEGLLGFINNFTKQMNTIIKKVWSYPLHILPSKIEEGETVDLDYKFPMYVNISTNRVDDVSEGSKGMEEIINLAYRIVAMRYLGLQDFPLFLDEFAASFDAIHRNSAMHAIKNMMDTMPFSQLFMVSHYESTYGAFTNAEICVMCDTNVIVPAGCTVNQHVKKE